MRHALAALMVGSLAAQSPQYWMSPAPAASPGVHYVHRMVFDSSRNVAVLFSGLDGGNTLLDDTWEWDGQTWQHPTPAIRPPGRHAHAMAYDVARQRVVVFGGGVNSTDLSDTWEWDGATWSQIFPPASPSPRRYAAAVYDEARQRTVLFGGIAGGTNVNDTWEWDGANWTLRLPVHSPSARNMHAMAYDSARQRCVLFGGWNDATATYLGDVWEWDGTSWLAGFSLTYPPARRLAAMAYDRDRQRTVLFAGMNPTFLADTWEWDGAAWHQAPSTNSPPAREQSAMAYDNARHQMVLFGGWGASCLGDTWLSVPASVIEYGTGCGTPPLGLVRDAGVFPVVGQTCTSTITNCPTLIAGAAMGFSNEFFGPFALPVPLNSVGMTGCLLWHSAELMGFPVTPLTATTMSFSFAIPNQASLVGAHAFIQAYALAPGQNPLQVIASNAVDWRVGTF